MAVFNSFTFDEINSLSHGIYVTGEAVFNAPERMVEMIQIPGKNGALAIDQGYFSNIEVTYPAGCFADSMRDFADKIAEFRNVLASRYSYKTLTDTYHPGEYRLALYKAGLEVSPVRYNSAAQFSITFECKPQRWLTSGNTVKIYTRSGGTLTNPTLFEAKPLISVTGSGTVTVGDKTLTVLPGTSSSQTIYIDCETMEAWEILEGGGMIFRNDYVQNADDGFPTLKPGDNTVLGGTGISFIRITPRWWTI